MHAQRNPAQLSKIACHWKAHNISQSKYLWKTEKFYAEHSVIV